MGTSTDTPPPFDDHDSLEHQYHANKRLGALFKTLDHNGDGFIDLEELKGYMDAQGHYGKMTEDMARVSYTDIKICVWVQVVGGGRGCFCSKFIIL